MLRVMLLGYSSPWSVMWLPCRWSIMALLQKHHTERVGRGGGPFLRRCIAARWHGLSRLSMVAFGTASYC